MATVQQWDDFTQDAAQKLETAQQNMTSILNDPQASQSRKDEARTNYQKQKMFYDQLVAKNEEVQISGIAPASWTVDGETKGSAIYQWSDSKYYPVNLGYPLSGKISDSFTFASAEHFEIVVTYTYPARAAENAMISLESGFPPTGTSSGSFGLQPGSGGIWTDDFSWTATDTKGNLTSTQWSFDYSSSYVHHPCISVTAGNVPTLYAGMTVGVGTWNGSVPTRHYIAGGYISVTIPQATVDDPWDYYNDELMPDINPDDRMYPDGYEPEPEPQPDEPNPEPRDLPHDEGDPAGLQDRSLGAPTMFITQYALTYGEISTVGLNLWSSWLTTNTDVWKNFFLPYQQDFGTLNISAAMETIISLRAYPFEIPLDLLLPSPNGVRMGTGHTDFLGGAATVVKTTICKIPLGECEVKPESPYDDFRDMYNASISCFLPYCGTVSLNPAEVIGRTLKCYYLIDFQSGGCTAVITLVGDSGEYILASKSGQIGSTLPMTATNAGQLAARTMSDAVQTVGTIGGFFFDAAGSVSRSAENAVKAGAGAESGGVDSESNGMTATESLGVGKSAFNTVLSIANQKLDRMSRSGVDIPMISGGSGAEAMFFPDTAIVTIRRGKYAKPENYPHSQGHLNGSSNTISYYKGSWGDYSPQTGKGLCKFTGVDTTGLTCHEDERAEILAILESGIYL